MNRRERKRLEGTAYHEAGHAVAAFLLRRPFRYVTVEPNAEAGTLGHLRPQTDAHFAPDVRDDASTRRRVESEIMVCMAGGLAESTFTGRRNHVGAGRDYGQAVDLACYVAGGDREAGAFVGWLTERARNMLALPWHWAAVRALAAALVDRSRIGGPAARQIIRQAMRDEIENRRPTKGEAE